MRLVEFYAMPDEEVSASCWYTLEPERDGRGRLLRWEEVTYAGSGEGEEAAQGETSYEELAHGDVDRLIGKLSEVLEDVVDEAGLDEVRELWAEAEESGDVVRVEQDGRAEVVPAMNAKDDAEIDIGISDEEEEDTWFYDEESD